MSEPNIYTFKNQLVVLPEGVEPTEENLQAVLDEAAAQADTPIVIPAAERRSAAKTQLDQMAGRVRASFVSAGSLVEEEYRLALQHTQAWRAAGSPADEVPAAIHDWATAAGMNNEQAATAIEQTSAAWEGTLLNIRKLRLEGKAAIDNGADDADFDALAQPYLQQLRELMP